MKRPSSLILTAILATALVQLPAASYATPASQLSSTDANEIATSYENLTTNYYKKVDAQAVLDGIHTAVLAQLKASGVSQSIPSLHALDLPNANVHAIDGEIESAAKLAGAASSGGVGVTLQPVDIGKDHYVAVDDVVAGGPAESAGIQSGDVIAAIDGASGKNLSVAVAGTRLRGKEGSSVVLTLERYGALSPPLTMKRAKLSTHELSYAAIDGMMQSVHDRYTVFLGPKEYSQLNGTLDGGDFGGTGIVIQSDDKTKFITVENVVPDGPADKAGIQQDDLITAIDGKSTKGMSINTASSHLRGKEGTKVTITIDRDGQQIAPIALTRAKIHQLSVYEKMLPNNIGYVALTVFGKDTGPELTTALDRLQQRGARAIVMDLRNNGGGYLEAAVAVSSKFISAGPIVSVESRASNITTLEADDTAIPPMPLAVLVNGYTASASEITSGAIQDSDVGTIIGTKTFGKGVVQTIYPLADGSAVKITTARYLTPHNRDINHLGITPDIVLAENKGAAFGIPEKDAQLRRALQFLDDRIAHLDSANGS